MLTDCQESGCFHCSRSIWVYELKLWRSRMQVQQVCSWDGASLRHRQSLEKTQWGVLVQMDEWYPVMGSRRWMTKFQQLFLWRTPQNRQQTDRLQDLLRAAIIDIVVISTIISCCWWRNWDPAGGWNSKVHHCTCPSKWQLTIHTSMKKYILYFLE